MLKIKFLVITLLLIAAGTSNAQNPVNRDELPSQAELEQVLAPIALYPDTLLSHILIAATYPLEVIQAERWSAKHPSFKGVKAVQAVEDETWDPSVKALVAFPRILQRLSQDLEWTQKLGEAFLQDEPSVLNSIQSLRKLAARAGNLDNLDKLAVRHDRETIILEPRERDVVYLPYYNTRTVYGPWRWSRYQPVHWDYPYHGHRHSYDHHPSFYWGPRVSVSFGFFFNTLHWRDRHIVRIHGRYYQPHDSYSRRQIIDHHYAYPWAHDPIHRRGVIYRNRALRNYYRNRVISRRASNVSPDTPQHQSIEHPSHQNTSRNLRERRVSRHIDDSINRERANARPNLRRSAPNQNRQRMIVNTPKPRALRPNLQTPPRNQVRPQPSGNRTQHRMRVEPTQRPQSRPRPQVKPTQHRNTSNANRATTAPRSMPQTQTRQRNATARPNQTRTRRSSAEHRSMRRPE